jgi:hypothetical protein
MFIKQKIINRNNLNNNELIEEEMNLSPGQNMFDLPDSILIKELKSLNSSGKRMNE